MLFACEEKINISDVEDALGGTKVYRNRIFGDDLESEITSWKIMEKNLKKKYFMYIRSQTKSDSEAARKLGLAPSNYYRTCKDLGIK